MRQTSSYMNQYRQPDTLVDLHAIALLLTVEAGTVRQWRQRNQLPEPDYQLRVGPVWWRSTIVAWAKQTGRWEY